MFGGKVLEVDLSRNENQKIDLKVHDLLFWGNKQKPRKFFHQTASFPFYSFQLSFDLRLSAIQVLFFIVAA